MRINRVEIDSFMAIGTATLSLNSQGLVLIQGENADDSSQNSNGAGKSSLVEAINWALFGETARGDTADAIINDKDGKDTRVLVQLVDGERTYNVIRHRKHSTHKNRLLLVDVTDPDDPIDKTAGTDKATQDGVCELIGCSPDVFRAAIYYGQESQLSLPDQTDKALKMIVEEAAGIEKMIEAYAVARTELNSANAAVNAAASNVDRHKFQVESHKERLAQFEIDRVDKAAEIESTAKAQIEKAKALLLSRKEALDELEKIDTAALQAEKETLVEAIGRVKHESEHLEALGKKYARLEGEIRTMESDIAKSKTSAQAIKAKIENLNAEIGTACDQCGHIIAEENIASRSKSLTDAFRSNISEAKELLSKLGELREALSEAHTAVEAHKASMTDVSESSARLRAIDEALMRAGKLEMNAEHLQKQAGTFKESAKKLASSPNPLDGIIEKEKESLAKAEVGLEEAKKALQACEEDLTVAKEVAEIFGPAGIRAHILDTVTPFLNDRTARYLGILSDGNIDAVWSTLTKGAKGELKEKFAIEVTSRTGGSTFRSLSGGEKRKVRLATALALQDLVSSRATKPIELWIGDEIDDAVDVSGLERLMTVLEEKAKEKGTVLIISHNELSDWCRQQTTVLKSGGRATVTGSLVISREEVGV